MQRFSFRARTDEGKVRKGVVEATSLKVAAQILRDQKLYIVNLHDQGQGWQSYFSFSTRIKYEDIVNFTRQLSTMISAGLPLTDALTILQSQTSPALQTKIEDIQRSIEGGSNFADALDAHSEVFSNVYIALIRAGESAGVIDTILERLADNLEKQREFRAKTKGALIYPVIVLIGMTLVGAVMMIFVLPKLTLMYEDFDAELPLITTILIGFSNFLVKSWYLFIVLGFGLAYGLRKWRGTKFGARKYDEFMLKLPIFGIIRERVILAEFTRTLSLLISAGVPLVEGLKIVSGVVDNRVFSDAMEVVTKDVEKGNPLAVALARHESFPIIVSQMVSVGEQTGKLDEILDRVAGYFEKESEHAIKNLSVAMEPIIMVVLGVGVGFLIVAIVVPIYNLTSVF